MTRVAQPSLFDSPPSPHAEDESVRICSCCGAEEVSGWLLRNNHGPADYRAGGVCMAMNLTRNHVVYYGREVARIRQVEPRTKTVAAELARAEEGLADSIARVRTVWPDTSWLSDVLPDSTLDNGDPVP
jgi:hypothetical protein